MLRTDKGKLMFCKSIQSRGADSYYISFKRRELRKRRLSSSFSEFLCLVPQSPFKLSTHNVAQLAPCVPPDCFLHPEVWTGRVSASGTQRKTCTNLVHAGGKGRYSYLPVPVLFLCIMTSIIQSLEMI